MKTKRIDSPDEAAAIIRSGGIVAFPTETVFGIGVDASNQAAVDRLYVAKGRPSDNPLIVHISDIGHWPTAAAQLTGHAQTLLDTFAPGPITVVVPKHASISSRVTAGLNTVGIRVPELPVAREILQLAGVPVAAPSANRSGRPSGTTWQAVLEDFDGRIDAVVCADPPRVGIESTVVDCTTEPPVILRPGAITIEQIQSVVPAAVERRHRSDDGQSESNQVKSPGLLHPHYQPRAKVVLVESWSALAPPTGNVAICGIQTMNNLDEIVFCQKFTNVESYAAGFYEFLRESDRRQVDTIFVQAAPDHGIGRALLDRQQRAAAPSS